MPSTLQRPTQGPDAGHPRKLKVVKTNRGNGEICKIRSESTGDDLGKIKATLDQRFDWIWHEDWDQQVQRARTKLRKVFEARQCAVAANQQRIFKTTVVQRSRIAGDLIVPQPNDLYISKAQLMGRHSSAKGNAKALMVA
ncbi:MAG: hypothetical protein Q9181_004966 [Wetmoreana brouardii]